MYFGLTSVLRLSHVRGDAPNPWFDGGMTEEIRAEMMANVSKVVAHEGDTVADGAEIVILESMKMEVPAVTHHAGRVTKVAVAEGDVVREGDLIAVVE